VASSSAWRATDEPLEELTLARSGLENPCVARLARESLDFGGPCKDITLVLASRFDRSDEFVDLAFEELLGGASA
jgi:hypothetical protein